MEGRLCNAARNEGREMLIIEYPADRRRARGTSEACNDSRRCACIRIGGVYSLIP